MDFLFSFLLYKANNSQLKASFHSAHPPSRQTRHLWLSAAFLTFLRPVKPEASHDSHPRHLISCSVRVRERPWTFNSPKRWWGHHLSIPKHPPSLAPPAKTMCPSIYNPLSLQDTQVFISDPSAQCWTLASAARFNRRKLGIQNRPVVKGHAAPSASIQTMENLPMFSFHFLLKHCTNNEAILWLTVSTVSRSLDENTSSNCWQNYLK